MKMCCLSMVAVLAVALSLLASRPLSAEEFIIRIFNEGCWHGALLYQVITICYCL